jgi:signal transduction histidine kinase
VARGTRGPTGSLERSLQWALGLLAVTVLLLLTGSGLWLARQGAEHFVAARLAHDAQALVAGLDAQSGVMARVLPPVYNQPFSGHYYEVRLPEGRIIRSRSLWDQALEIAALETGRTAVDLRDGPRGQRLLVWRAGYEQGGKAFTVAVAEDLTPLLQGLQRLLWAEIGLSMLGVLALLLVQRWLLRRGFRRVGAVRRDIRRLEAGEVDRLREDVPAEIQPLVRELNLFIGAWRRHLTRSRQSLGNLAHALKSPLNLILLHHPPGKGDPASEQALRMRGLIDRELRRARLTGEGVPGRRFRPREDIADLAAGIRALYRGKALEITTRVDTPERLPFDQEDMLELIGNLADNAAKWAARRVHLELAWRNGLQVRVADDGPGVAPAASEAMTERGRRLDETTAGHGLGLAIAREIVELHGGRLELGRAPDLGGLEASIALPRPAG